MNPERQRNGPRNVSLSALRPDSFGSHFLSEQSFLCVCVCVGRGEGEEGVGVERCRGRYVLTSWQMGLKLVLSGLMSHNSARKKYPSQILSSTREERDVASRRPYTIWWNTCARGHV